MLDILVLHLEEVLSALLHELEGRFELLDGNHLDAEEFHAHQQADYALGRVGARVSPSELLQLLHEASPHRHKTGLCQSPDHFRVKIRYDMYVSSVWSRLDSIKDKRTTNNVIN